MITPKQRSIAIYSLASILLIIPFIGMQFSKSIQWDLRDFLIAGLLLFSTAFGCDYVLRNMKTSSTRFLWVAIILIVVFLIWIELAVGVFGSPFAGS